MPHDCPNLERLIRRIHRRLILLRAVEGVGIGLLLGALAASTLYLASIYRGERVSPWIGLVMPAGALVGVAWSVLRRPAPFRAALEADRQLGLSELLSTAWVIRESGHDPLSAAVLAVAECRCKSLAISDLVLHRLGRRAWGSIGLFCALSLVLALLADNPITPPQTAQAGALAIASLPVGREPDHPPAALPSVHHRSSPLAPDHPGGEEDGMDLTRNTENTVGHVGPSARTADAANPDGAGAGAGRSTARGGVQPLITDATNASRQASGGELAGGAGAADDPAGAGRSGAAAGRAVPSPTVPPWQTSTWPAAVQQAAAALRQGTIPSPYFDIVRAYFQRD